MVSLIRQKHSEYWWSKSFNPRRKGELFALWRFDSTGKMDNDNDDPDLKELKTLNSKSYFSGSPRKERYQCAITAWPTLYLHMRACSARIAHFIVAGLWEQMSKHARINYIDALCEISIQ